MSKLNEEIIDCLQYWLDVEPTEDMDWWIQTRESRERTQLLLNYFEARRHIEECRREEDD